jgi:diguanylate cyclase (GGDEF)-like protein/PAS domain S-box-containing protein
VLLIDDGPDHAAAMQAALVGTGEGFLDLEWVRSLAAGLKVLADHRVRAVFLSLSLPDGRGADTLTRVLSVASDAPVIVLGGVNDEAICQAALSQGARDYLLEGHLDTYAFARAMRNISERDLAQHELFLEKERAEVTLNSIGDAVLSTDIEGCVTYLNVVAEQMTGWPRKDAIGHPLTEVFRIIDSVTRQPSPNPLALAIQLDRSVGLSANCILIRRDGHESFIEDSAAPIHDRDGQLTGAVIVFHDVSMARSMVLEMSHLAQHDSLTGLPNRLVLKDRLARAILLAHRHSGHLALLFLDVDHFKRINDSLGHALGDALLQSVAARLSASVRESDTVSRQGGDEFVILLSELARPADAGVNAAHILAELKKVHRIGAQELRVTASVGISTYPDCGDDADALLKHADTAMYHAKEHGRDSYQFFRRDMNLRAVERQSLEGQLRVGLEQDQLRLHYQPKVNLTTGAITSVEALIRWQHPTRGLLLPAQFLTIAEDSNLMVAIGRWVLREACRQTREWLDAGVQAVPVAVNISSLEFRSEQFLEGVRMALKESRLDPRYLELELTETVLMRHAESTAFALDRLKALGVRLAIDDFGTSYSSLSYLTRFPIDALKLDRSFVHGVIASADHAIIVRAVIDMGQSLKHRVIAEGVETPEQLAFLQIHGCDEGQGHYFSRPIMPPQFAQLLQTGVKHVAQHAHAVVKGDHMKE